MVRDMFFLNKWAIKAIRIYQKNKALIGNNHCKHYPSCSAYSIEAYSKFNFFYASILTIWRILRCNPFTKKVYDPVPLTKSEKKSQKTISSN
jgi:putative membrane protein insertion efficiency factor